MNSSNNNLNELSGSIIRKLLLEDKNLPKYLIRPEIAKILKNLSRSKPRALKRPNTFRAADSGRLRRRAHGPREHRPQIPETRTAGRLRSSSSGRRGRRMRRMGCSGTP